MKLCPQQLAAALGGEASGNKVRAPGPGHSPQDRSLSVIIGPEYPDSFYTHSFAGDDPIKCKDYVREKAGLGRFEPERRPKADNVARMSDRVRRTPMAKAGSAAATYIYRQADGTPYLRVVRPGFFQSRWDGNAWISGAPKGPKIPYRLPELTEAEHDNVLIVEGEKDADRLASLGLLATTNSGGAEKWTADLNVHFTGCDVYILPDNDEPGERHAKQVAEHLAGIARTIRIVHLPGIAHKEDVSDWLDAGGTVDQLTDLLRYAPEIAETAQHIPDDVPSLPVIQIKNGELSSLATQAEELLIAAGVPIYQRGGRLVRPIIETVDASRGRKTQIAQLNVLDKVYARDILSRNAMWEKWDARAKQGFPINPPEEIAVTMLARVGDWTFPSIAGVISTPTMRPDGSLLLDAGYDHATRLLLVKPPSMPTIPERPTRKDAEAALMKLEELLTGFSFVDAIAKACALSAIITPVVRGAFPVTPMHASRAPTAGSGKSFLWDIVAAIAIGQLMPVMSTGASEDETEKRLGAALMAGQPLISLDNISGELGGDALCQIIERPVVDIRILGRSERVRIEAGGTCLFATGNNFTIVGDVCRRAITTNLDPEVERPELRQFAFDPIERVLSDRGQYIAAALTICRAYIVAGRPNKAPALGSFEGWSDTVRSALLWLGKDDPVKSMESARAEDPERIELSDMLESWGAVIGIGSSTRMKLAAVLLKGLSQSKQAEGADMEPTYPDFHAALMTMAQRSASRSGRGAPADAKMFGKWLQRFKGRIVNGKRFMSLPNERHGSEWWVEQV